MPYFLLSWKLNNSYSFMHMDKCIFINVSDLESWNFDSNDNSWEKSPRLSRLKSSHNKLKVCLFGLAEKELSVVQIGTLLKFSGWGAELYTLSDDFNIEDGFFPLMYLVNDSKASLYFTDVIDNSYFNSDWAVDNIYKTEIVPYKKDVFIPYQPVIPAGWNRGVLDANQIEAKDLFDLVYNKFPEIKQFCSENVNANDLEIIYSDRYVRSELSLSICILFMDNLINKINPDEYTVVFKGQTYYEPNFNVRTRLADNYQNDQDRDKDGKRLTDYDVHFTFTSVDISKIPHFRELTIKSGDNKLIIMPDAGIAHWGIDGDKCREKGVFYSVDNIIKPEMPISSNTEQIYYVKACKEQDI